MCNNGINDIKACIIWEFLHAWQFLHPGTLAAYYLVPFLANPGHRGYHYFCFAGKEREHEVGFRNKPGQLSGELRWLKKFIDEGHVPDS